jgi:hypothetical protein
MRDLWTHAAVSNPTLEDRKMADQLEYMAERIIERIVTAIMISNKVKPAAAFAGIPRFEDIISTQIRELHGLI